MSIAEGDEELHVQAEQLLDERAHEHVLQVLGERRVLLQRRAQARLLALPPRARLRVREQP